MAEIKFCIHCLDQSETIMHESLLACFLSARFLLSYILRTLCLGNGTTHNELGLPTPAINQDSPLQTSIQANKIKIIRN